MPCPRRHRRAVFDIFAYGIGGGRDAARFSSYAESPSRKSARIFVPVGGRHRRDYKLRCSSNVNIDIIVYVVIALPRRLIIAAGSKVQGAVMREWRDIFHAGTMRCIGMTLAISVRRLIAVRARNRRGVGSARYIRPNRAAKRASAKYLRRPIYYSPRRTVRSKEV